MTMHDLKTDLHRLIDQIDDDALLQAVRTILAREVSAEEINWYTPSEAERKAIQEGLNNIEQGNVIPHEEVMRKVKDRFKL